MHDYVFNTLVHKIGFWAAIRYVRGLGIDFEDAYYMAFGRLPSR